MGTLIKGFVFLIIGIAVAMFTAISAVVVMAALAGVALGWLITLPPRTTYKRWREKRQSQVL
jgi:predicted membrane chloride channel (bestrophin family)